MLGILQDTLFVYARETSGELVMLGEERKPGVFQHCLSDIKII